MIFSNISSIDPGKGLIDYVTAIERLKGQENLFFEIVGKASGVNEAFEERLCEIISKKKLKEIIVVRGFIADIKAYLESVDVVVLTSTTEEALPTVLIEAMARGKVIIATDVGGVREIVPEGYGNLVIPPGNSCILAEALEKVSQYDREIREKIARLNRQYAYEHFRLEKQIRQMSLLYREVCSK
ncbi:glycosyltransferase family 4 protein [Hydrogenimonas sp.]